MTQPFRGIRFEGEPDLTHAITLFHLTGRNYIALCGEVYAFPFTVLTAMEVTCKECSHRLNRIELDEFYSTLTQRQRRHLNL